MRCQIKRARVDGGKRLTSPSTSSLVALDGDQRAFQSSPANCSTKWPGIVVGYGRVEGERSRGQTCEISEHVVPSSQSAYDKGRDGGGVLCDDKERTGCYYSKGREHDGGCGKRSTRDQFKRALSEISE